MSSRTGLKLGRYTLTRVIGSGAYGVVYCATTSSNEDDNKTGSQVAVKCLPKRHRSHTKLPIRQIPLSEIPLRYYETRDRAYREVALHAMVHSHPNIVTIHQVYESHDTVYVVMDYFSTGDLFHAITNLKLYAGKEPLVRSIFTQLTDAVTFCHRNGVYHCDLKPENILVSEDGSQVQIADFGLATRQPYSGEFGCGSSFYMSPERWTTNPQAKFSTPLSDIWALGMILLNLTCGRNPWKKATPLDDPSYRVFCQDRSFLQRIMPISRQLNDILNSVFDPHPLRRPTLLHFSNVAMMNPLTKREEVARDEAVRMVAPLTPVSIQSLTPRTNSPFDDTFPAFNQPSHFALPSLAPEGPVTALLPAFEFIQSPWSSSTRPCTPVATTTKRKRSSDDSEESAPVSKRPYSIVPSSTASSTIASPASTLSSSSTPTPTLFNSIKGYNDTFATTRQSTTIQSPVPIDATNPGFQYGLLSPRFTPVLQQHAVFNKQQLIASTTHTPPPQIVYPPLV